MSKAGTPRYIRPPSTPGDTHRHVHGPSRDTLPKGPVPFLGRASQPQLDRSQRKHNMLNMATSRTTTGLRKSCAFASPLSSTLGSIMSYTGEFPVASVALLAW